MKTTIRFEGAAAVSEAIRVENDLKKKNIIAVKKIYDDTHTEVSYEEPKPPIFA